MSLENVPQSDILLAAPVKDIDTSGRFRQDMGAIEELAASIEKIGLLHPIIVGMPNAEGKAKLIVGERRLRAYKHLKRETIPVRVVEDLAEAQRAFTAEQHENNQRKPFTMAERLAAERAITPMLREAADANRLANLRVDQVSTRENGPYTTSDTDSARSEAPGPVKDQLADLFAIGSTTATRDLAVLRALDRPDLTDQERATIEKGVEKDSTNAAYLAAKRALRRIEMAETPDSPPEGEPEEPRPLSSSEVTAIMRWHARVQVVVEATDRPTKSQLARADAEDRKRWSGIRADLQAVLDGLG